MKCSSPTMLMILDGFGSAPAGKGNAISLAKTPHLDSIFQSYPHTTIKACGLDVGLPDGQMGNSEVGHMNIGAGRIVYQDLTRITKAVEDGSFFANPAFQKAVDHVKHNNSALHFFGLVSDGGVHSHIDHLLALIDLAKKNHIEKVFVHCFLDGRDVPPNCAQVYTDQLEAYMKEKNTGSIATISGRYYAMDRDKRWERLEKAYTAMTSGKGQREATAAAAIAASYERNQADEFLLPTVVNPDGLVHDNDAIIMFNFRPDRAREITRAFVDTSFDGFEREKVISNLTYVCMTQYDTEMPNVLLAYPPESYANTLGQYVSSQGLRQLRIAETEKYAHVTFFFNGGVEDPNPGEERILIPSPKVATYDMQPEMSAPEVTEAVLKEIEKDQFDLIILNFANADMVGHTGVMEAAIKAIETLDGCVPSIVEAMLAKDGTILLTADHGNADVMLDEESNVVTAHSLNPVPLVHISKNAAPLLDDGRLCDLAPSLLTIMGLPIPEEMTGHSLLKK